MTSVVDTQCARRLAKLRIGLLVEFQGKVELYDGSKGDQMNLPFLILRYDFVH